MPQVQERRSVTELERGQQVTLTLYGNSDYPPLEVISATFWRAVRVGVILRLDFEEVRNSRPWVLFRREHLLTWGLRKELVVISTDAVRYL